MRIQLFNAILVLICGHALWRGGRPEQYVALLFLAAAGVAITIRGTVRAPFMSMHQIIVLIDVVILVALVTIALQANRFWTLWMAAFQLVAVAMALMLILDSKLTQWIYVVLHGVWSYPMLAILAVATVRHRQRLTRDGADACWSNSFDRWRSGTRGNSQTG